jgi:hypothetical protein
VKGRNVSEHFPIGDKNGGKLIKAVFKVLNTVIGKKKK